jgi:SWI/SNF-related matrix-associated actin-dependent regulator of chromatin subfamily A member 5
LRTVAKIEEGEAKLAKLNEVQGVLSKRVSGLTAPLHQLKINYGQIKGRSYSEEEDRFLLVMLDKFGYGEDSSFEKIRSEIKRSSLFRFNWFLRSRNAGELSKRCSTLLLCIMKEWEEEQKDKEGGEPSAKKAKTTGGVELSTKSFFASKTASIPRKARK